MLTANELAALASTASRVKAPVATFTPKPRRVGDASLRPLLPLDGVPRICCAGAGGGVGSVRGAAFSEKPETRVVPSVAVRATVTTYSWPACRFQPSALSSAQQ